jgi:CheY-like chemotaxis protein
MGIPICVRIAELMGGYITLEDRRYGPGTCFSLRLPLAGPAAAAAAAATIAEPAQLPVSAATTTPRNGEALPARGAVPAAAAHNCVASPAPSHRAAPSSREVRGTRVLAVDDSPANLRFMVYMLKRLECTVETCEDGDQVVGALAAAVDAGTPFDLVIMDMYMGRVHGDAALAALRVEGHALPVVLCTANATSADVARYTALGFCGVLGKPFTPEQLRGAVAAAPRLVVQEL